VPIQINVVLSVCRYRDTNRLIRHGGGNVNSYDIVIISWVEQRHDPMSIRKRRNPVAIREGQGTKVGKFEFWVAIWKLVQQLYKGGRIGRRRTQMKQNTQQ
jgi:hypothetical protein